MKWRHEQERLLDWAKVMVKAKRMVTVMEKAVGEFPEQWPLERSAFLGLCFRS